MIYYVLPGVGVYGGIKKAFQCADMLNTSGYRTQLATPGGEKPTWFEFDSPVIDRSDLPAGCVASDIVLFSWPPDADFVTELPALLKVVHMQGANTQADESLLQRCDEFDFISQGLHMSLMLLRHRIVAPYSPNSIAPVFRYGEEPKKRNSIAYMPRKGAGIIASLMGNIKQEVVWRPIEYMTERQVAEVLKKTDIFLALSPDEAFGLPPLEAMSAMCCVVGFPGDGGLEFMHHGETAHVVPNNDNGGLQEALEFVLDDPDYRDDLRLAAFNYSAYYSPERERDYLIRALELLKS